MRNSFIVISLVSFLCTTACHRQNPSGGLLSEGGAKPLPPAPPPPPACARQPHFSDFDPYVGVYNELHGDDLILIGAAAPLLLDESSLNLYIRVPTWIAKHFPRQSPYTYFKTQPTVGCSNDLAEATTVLDVIDGVSLRLRFEAKGTRSSHRVSLVQIKDGQETILETGEFIQTPMANQGQITREKLLPAVRSYQREHQDVDEDNTTDQSLEWPAGHGRLKLVRKILKRGAPSNEIRPALIEAVRAADLEMVKLIWPYARLADTQNLICKIPSGFGLQYFDLTKGKLEFGVTTDLEAPQILNFLLKEGVAFSCADNDALKFLIARVANAESISLIGQKLAERDGAGNPIGILIFQNDSLPKDGFDFGSNLKSSGLLSALSANKSDAKLFYEAAARFLPPDSYKSLLIAAGLSPEMLEELFHTLDAEATTALATMNQRLTEVNYVSYTTAKRLNSNAGVVAQVLSGQK